jgi:hypothetical protein
MKLADLQTIPLDRAVLCSDCSAIGQNTHACPCCGNAFNLMPLATWLNRKKVSE